MDIADWILKALVTYQVGKGVQNYVKVNQAICPFLISLLLDHYERNSGRESARSESALSAF